MQINVAGLMQDPIGSVRTYEIDGEVDFGDGKVKRVTGKVQLLRTPRGILVQVEAETEADLNCSRCLEPFSHPVSLKIEEEYLPTQDILTGERAPVPDEPGTFRIDERHIIDLTEAIRQYTLLAVPMKPLCKADCAGICPTCGQNWNRGACACPPPEGDTHRAKLQKLLGK
jgi:uncharacterized protein